MRPLAPLAVAALLLAACGSDSATESPVASSAGTATTAAPAAEPLDVVAGFAPLAELATRIGGDRVNVTNLTAPGGSAHDLELTPKQTEELEGADLVVWLGLRFQPSVADAVGQLPESQAKVDVLDGLTLQDAGEGGHEGEGEEHAEGEEPADGEEHEGEEQEGGKDPHVWVDPGNVISMIAPIQAALTSLDPSGADSYAANAASYQADLEKLVADITAGLATCSTRTVVTSHDAFGYFTNRFDLEQLPIAGLSPDDEPSPKELAEIAEAAKEAGVKAVFFEDSLPPGLSETVANEIGADIAVLNPIETITQEDLDAGRGYLDVQRANLEALRAGLGCS
jgi:zinc transport system substrate-binding protein